MGFEVTGVDPSGPSLEVARAHAASSGLNITYVQGPGEHLPFPDASFDVAYCCDVLEHVDDVDTVIGETARVLRPGGTYLFDTINRTPMSRLVLIKLAQDWRWSSFMPPNLHDWAMFIKPAELRAIMRRHGFEVEEITGCKPGANPLAVIAAFWRWKRGTISFREFGEAIRFARTNDTSGLYMGYARKAA